MLALFVAVVRGGGAGKGRLPKGGQPGPKNAKGRRRAALIKEERKKNPISPRVAVTECGKRALGSALDGAT